MAYYETGYNDYTKDLVSLLVLMSFQVFICRQALREPHGTLVYAEAFRSTWASGLWYDLQKCQIIYLSVSI